ncbi:MAG TPA: protease inhibitor I42 family protein [Gemmataceae bacterium]|nr:protease inhibitor I42 family protein [Gemmataceae bacterium]
MRHVKRALLLAGALALLAVPAARADEGTKAKTVTVTDKEDKGKVTVPKGGALVVKLPITTGTGYTWVIAKNNADQLKSVGKSTIEKPDKPLPGAKTIQVFRFDAAAAGSSELTLEYKRPFEKDKPPAKTYKITVKVE